MKYCNKYVECINYIFMGINHLPIFVLFFNFKNQIHKYTCTSFEISVFCMLDLYFIK